MSPVALEGSQGAIVSYYRSGFSRRVLALCFVASIVLHVTMLASWHWQHSNSAPAITEHTRELSLTIRHKTASPTPSETPREEPAPDKAIEPAKPEVKSTTPPVSPGRNTSHRERPEREQPVDYGDYRVPNTSPDPIDTGASRVFDPRLRAKLQRKSTRADQSALPLDNSSTVDLSGATHVNIDGHCFRAQRQNKRGVARDWYMTGCNEDASEGDALLQGLRARLRAKDNPRGRQ